jgi:hypothetical protein
VQGALPLIEKAGLNLNVFYIASAELFDLLTEKERAAIFPDEFANEAMGITGFTLATMYRWVRSSRGRAATMHPFMKGHYLGSGAGAAVLKEAGLDGESQFKAIQKFMKG